MIVMFSHAEAVAIAMFAPIGAIAIGERSGVARWTAAEYIDAIRSIDADAGPRWIWWDAETARALVAAGIRPVRCWDIDAVHRLINGGWRAGPARSWAATHGLDTDDLPTLSPNDLFSAADDTASDGPVRGDGYLDPDWIAGAWHDDLDHLHQWAVLALEVYQHQVLALDALDDRPAAPATARSESAAALLCAELEHDGLPLDITEAERIIATFIGPRPSNPADDARSTAARDERVLVHLDGTSRDGIDLRNPNSVKSLLRRVGVEVDDTRAWRLERRRDEHPIIEAVLDWRRAERIATTFGYRWLDQHVGSDGRLRGTWSGSDGAAGRMTATAGLHNLPAELRPAVIAEPGHVFIRADLGQIEPRILAAVSGDRELAAATRQADMYASVADELGVTRDIAKVAVLGAMYGQTTGHGAAALRGLERAYPVAMGHLTDAARLAEGGHDLRTRGGRLVRMSTNDDSDDGDDAGHARSRAAARGRYGRNAMVQGAAAEFFKTWAAIVRTRASEATIVLCLHDELLVHAPEHLSTTIADAVDAAIGEAAFRWSDGPHDVRFVADISVIRRWSDAK